MKVSDLPHSIIPLPSQNVKRLRNYLTCINIEHGVMMLLNVKCHVVLFAIQTQSSLNVGIMRHFQAL